MLAIETTEEITYDYARVFALMETLATDPSDKALITLCQEWGIKPVQTSGGRQYFLTRPTIKRMAQHALEHARY